MKQCSRCKRELYTSEFYGSARNKDGLGSWCKECVRDDRKNCYRKNPQAKIAYQVKRRKERREYVDDYLRNNPCVDCGESNIIVLEFDHIADNKLSDICSMIYQEVSIAKLAAEIQKCEVRCANCHRIKTHERRIALK